MCTVLGVLFDKTGVYGNDVLEQGSSTRGPRAACGPPNIFMRPPNKF
jgi:hypothetical protein